MLTLLPSPSPFRLLLVEADEAVSTALSRGIRRAGWVVVHARTATAALQMRAEFGPDVVLLSLNLPDMDGGALAARLAEQGGCGVVAMSGRGDAAGQAVLARGAHDFITKPMAIRDVVARLDAAVRRMAKGASSDTMAPQGMNAACLT